MRPGRVNTSLPQFFLTSAQIRAARSLMRWTAENLAAASALSVATIRRAELKENRTALTSANDLAIRRALESAGVEFIDENGRGPRCPAAEAAAEKRFAQGVIANAGFRYDDGYLEAPRRDRKFRAQQILLGINLRHRLREDSL
jgi:hypothetical protein